MSAATDSRNRIEPAVTGLERVLAGDRFDEHGMAGPGRQFLGWAVGGHWILSG